MICAQAVQRNICLSNGWGGCAATQVTVIESKPICAAADLRLLTQPELQTLITQSTTSTTQTTPEFEPVTISKVFSAGFVIVVLFFLIGRGVGQVLRLIRFG